MVDQTDEDKRLALIKVYPGSKAWQTKVNNMASDQVVAIYLRLKAQGKI